MYNFNAGYGRAFLDAIHSVMPVFGRVLVVASTSDAGEERYDRMSQILKTDTSGRVRLFSTVAEAYAEAISNNNDVILLDADTTHVVTEMLTVAKNRVNFLGMDSGGRLTAQGAKIQIGVTGVATDLAPVLNTGVRNSFRNIKFINASTTNQTLYGFIENGEGTLMENCSAVKVAGLDDANHASLWLAGDSATIRNCTFGQSNIPNTAAGFGILIDGKTGGATDGTVKENFLENIYVNMSVGGSVQATSSFIKIADASALNFGNVINKIVCNNYMPNGGTVMTDAILCPTGITAGSLSIVSPAYFGCTGVADATVSGISVAAPGLAPDANGGLSTLLTD